MTSPSERVCINITFHPEGGPQLGPTFLEQVKECFCEPIDECNTINLTDELRQIVNAETRAEELRARLECFGESCVSTARLIVDLLQDLWEVLCVLGSTLYSGDFDEASLAALELVVLPIKKSLYISCCVVGIFLGIFMPNTVWGGLHTLGKMGHQ